MGDLHRAFEKAGGENIYCSSSKIPNTEPEEYEKL